MDATGLVVFAVATAFYLRVPPTIECRAHRRVLNRALCQPDLMWLKIREQREIQTHFPNPSTEHAQAQECRRYHW